jgi:hypothetical protein
MSNAKRIETTVGKITTKEKAQAKAESWRNPRMGYHAEAIKKGKGYICRLVINIEGGEE